jgi:Fe-S-cluster containining protein
MQLADTETASSIFTPLTGEVFHFNCHRDVSCFTSCCAKLRLILTPYDIIRMKKRLGLSSGEFLERYTDTLLHDHPRFSMIRLNMRDDEGQRCPFVTGQGCCIYEDRPGSCRLYPLGRASTLVPGGQADAAREQYFVVHENHCEGFKEERAWTLEGWVSHEGFRTYREVNDRWMEILNSPKSLGPENYLANKHKMFFMASYDIDRFRKFIFESRFFSLFEFSSEKKKEVAADDESLLLFAFDWLKFSLFGEKTLTPLHPF